MKHSALLFLILTVLGSCAFPRFSMKPKAKSSTTTSEKAPEAEPREGSREKPKGAKSKRTMAMFHIIEPLGFELILFNLEKNLERRVKVDKTLSQVNLRPGHWQLRGFVLNKERFDILNPSSQFIFTLRQKKITYVGSYIVKCPKVGEEYLPEIKKMNFFNRYPFRSKTGLCEIVVGSDYENVNRVWMEVGRGENKALGLGF